MFTIIGFGSFVCRMGQLRLAYRGLFLASCMMLLSLVLWAPGCTSGVSARGSEAVVTQGVGVRAVGARDATEASGEAVYQHGAVAADHPIASLAGVEMLRLGGNAVDAAVATSFCLSVVRPYSCGIGGGGFMLINEPGDEGMAARSIALNYREVAPAAVDGAYYTRLDDEGASRFGVHAVAVPGTVAGLLHALERWGTLDRETVLGPAIRAAREGFAVDADYVSACEHLAQLFDEQPQRMEAAGGIWRNLCRGGEVQVGDVVSQPAKARALELIAAQGADAFYNGEIARAIGEVMERHGGPMTRGDLAAYRVEETKPLRGRFGGYEVLTMPPPSSGGVAMLQIMGIFDRLYVEFESPEHNSIEYVHLLAEAMKHAFADRAEFLADPAFVDVPVERLLDAAYLDELAGRVRSDRPLRDVFQYGSARPANAAESGGGGTSHFCVVDGQGMAVACTETINLTFGSLVMVEEFGIVLNNEMDDFTTEPGQPNAFGLRQSERNLPEAGKRPLSSMSPTIVLKNGRAVAIAGASGGPRIITATMQVLVNGIVFRMSPAEAVGQVRFHHQWMPNVLEFERAWQYDRVQRTLEEMGHTIGQRGNVGVVQLIMIDEKGIRAASDGRKGGRPGGY